MARTATAPSFKLPEPKLPKIDLDTLFDDVVVGQDVAVARHDDTGAETLCPAFAVAEGVVLVGEEEAEKRIVGKGRVRRPHDLRR